jgi:hypothetical protein
MLYLCHERSNDSCNSLYSNIICDEKIFGGELGSFLKNRGTVKIFDGSEAETRRR